MNVDPTSPIPTVPASACPGLLRIVSALDGGLCRVKLPCGQLSVAQALTIADAAERCASGVLEITNRANLQIRGVREDYSNDLIEALIAANLGPLLPGGDDVRNVLLNPTFGIDPAQVLDTTPLALRVLESLQTQTHFHRLSPKFSISIDGGESAAMLEHPHDIWLSAIAAHEPMFVLGVAGCPLARNTALAIIQEGQALELIEATLKVFIDNAGAEQTRMRHLLQTISAAELWQRIQQHLSFSLKAVPAAWQRTHKSTNAHIGVHAQRQSGRCYIGAMPSLGRIEAAQLRALALLAQTFGDRTLRMTPFQSVLLPNIPQAVAEHVAQQLVAIGLVIDSKDARAHMIACTGANGCAKGRADTKADALQLIEKTGAALNEIDVHLTGCERSCAAAHVAPFTLLAVAKGRYDIYRRDENNCDDVGELIARNCDLEQCAEWLKKKSQELSHD